ncbi:Serine-threonine/tyrosine-protein kinase, catalytic domain [Dillenia turbinata]|uniref:Serine-threonine/tyrosine-protein kinase, catalytic domain n=1 Tax=Dillenia turbinata TaxID=194707 RepID=A0AAN8ZV05_9MAGN
MFERDMKYYVILVICTLCIFAANCIFLAIRWIVAKFFTVKRGRSSDGKVTDVTPISLPEVKVTFPARLIYGEEVIAEKYNPSDLAQLPKVRLGEGSLGTLFKVVLDCGSTVVMRKIRDGLVSSDELDFWIKFFGQIHDEWLLPVECSFWYGREAFLLSKYLCLGSLEELLHGSEGIKFTPLDWSIRVKIALCAAKAVASLHRHVTRNGEPLICGVIKSSNILSQTDYIACLSSYETPYLVSPATLIRRNPGRVAPELKQNHSYPKFFTQKSDAYSFGILLLELITCKRPSVINLAQLLKERKRKEGLRGLCDERLGEVKESVFEMVKIAEMCLLHNPNQRPSMDRVVQMIQKLQD